MREKGKRQRATGPKTAEEDAAASSSKEREQLKKKAEEERLKPSSLASWTAEGGRGGPA